MLNARSDVVGSLLRPPELLAAQADLAAGRIDAPTFKAIEDRAVDTAVAWQEQAGLAVVTDGEMRRLSFQSQMTECVDGFGDWDIDAFLWGDWHGEGDVGDKATARPTQMGVVAPLKRKRHLAAEEFTYLRARTTRIGKVTLPSPSLFANFWTPEVSSGAYPTLESFLRDVADILCDEVRELARLGARYLQLDAPHYPLLLDPATRAFYEARGWTLEQWLQLGVALDNAVIDAAPGVTFGFHLCRGNQGSRWLVAGDYAPIAAPLFRGVHAERLMLEYDDARSGSFEPLALVPDDKVAVLGLVTTKHGGLESATDLKARIDAASRHIALDRLAISPQCGFATSVVGNALTIDEQNAKLARLAEVAADVWG
jgi:5-methyltetrahydropteroyltriglutamate--homocysteine methyltransferase